MLHLLLWLGKLGSIITAAAAAAAGPLCNHTVDTAENKMGMVRNGNYFAASMDPAATKDAAGCALLCCATEGCQTFSLNVPWAGGNWHGCVSGNPCCFLAPGQGPLKPYSGSMNISTGLVHVAPQPLPTPTAQQLHYLENELSMFVHFSICTFNDGCDGGQQNDVYQGKQGQPWPASTFNPTDIDTDQWARAALGLGAKQVCLTVRHTGGFALWPTKASNYSVLASPFGKTERDIVKEFVTSMRKHELEPCFYIILPWDAAEWQDSKQQYFDVQKTMLCKYTSNDILDQPSAGMAWIKAVLF